MFIATTCNQCHAMGGAGGNVGPDLTNLGKRFSMKDMLESIIDPSKTISDQYAATQFTLANGSSIIGRLTDQDNVSFSVSRNPYSPDQVEVIKKKDVVAMRYSPISSMLPGLINSLNEEELKDLMAYLMTGGNAKDPVFKKEETP
jgi:putative heme-binding domain-containing protein